MTPKEIARRARAIENLVYVVSANTAGVWGEGIPAESVDGMSKIVDYKGIVLAAADTGETMVANAIIDIPALRASRQRPGMSNYFARQRLELFAEAYAQTVYPANSLTSDSIPQRAHFIDTQRATIERLIRDELV